MVVEDLYCFLDGKIRIFQQLGQYIRLYIIERGINVSTAIVENTFNSDFTKQVDSLFQKRQARIGGEVVIKVPHIVPYVYTAYDR